MAGQVKRLLVIVCTLLVTVALYGSYAGAQEPTPALDLGETNLLTLACQVSTAKALREGFTIKWCRKEEEIVTGNQALVVARIKIPALGTFKTYSSFQKSLWWVEGWTVEPE